VVSLVFVVLTEAVLVDDEVVAVVLTLLVVLVVALVVDLDFDDGAGDLPVVAADADAVDADDDALLLLADEAEEKGVLLRIARASAKLRSSMLRYESSEYPELALLAVSVATSTSEAFSTLFSVLLNAVAFVKFLEEAADPSIVLMYVLLLLALYKSIDVAFFRIRSLANSLRDRLLSRSGLRYRLLLVPIRFLHFDQMRRPCVCCLEARRYPFHTCLSQLFLSRVLFVDVLMMRV
jgi:hypothetical protein